MPWRGRRPPTETPEEPTAVDARQLGRVSPRSIPPAKEPSTPENVTSPSVQNGGEDDPEMSKAYSPISLFLRIGTDTPVEQTLDMIRKLGGSGIHCLQVSVDEGQRASIENRLERDGFDVEVKLLAGGDGQTQGTAAIIRVEQTVSHLELTRVVDRVLELGIKNVRLVAARNDALDASEQSDESGSGAGLLGPEEKPGAATTSTSSNRRLEVFQLSHADPSWVTQVLCQGFRDVEIIANPQRNVLAAWGSQEDLSKLKTVVEILDRPGQTQQRDDPSLAAAAREQYNELEQQAAQVAEQYRELSDEGKDETGDAATLKRQLSTIVSEAFEVRQKLQRAELTRLRQRLGRIEQQIAARQRIKDAIVDRRVEGLLHPDVRWDPAHQADNVPSGLTGRSSEQNPATAATADGSQSPDAMTLSSPAASQADDRERLVGAWEIVGAQDGGQPLPAEWRQKSGMVATNRELIFWEAGERAHNRFTYELNPSAAPREIDLTRQGGQAVGKLYPGIYKFEGERLVICFNEDGGMRPAEFISVRRSPEFDTVLMVLERIGPAPQLLKKTRP